MPGSLAIERIQAGLEATRFTALAATRRVYGEYSKAWYEPTVVREQIRESMSSLAATYRGVITEVGAKASIPGFVTASDLAWWGQMAWKGAVTGVLSNVAAYTYTFSPTLGSDDIKSATFEFFTDTQNHQLPGSFVDKFEVTWARGKALSFTADLVAQQDNPVAGTGSITDRTGLNPIAGTSAKVWIDAAGGTIGTTQALNVLGGKITWANNIKMVIHNQGALFADDMYRDPRLAAAELEIHYNTDTERAALMAGTERLVRVQLQGPNIPSSSPATPESTTFDLYGFWKVAPFGTNEAMRTIKLQMDTQVDSTAGFDWRVAVVNAVAALP